MAIQSILQYHDPRTGKSYAVQAGESGTGYTGYKRMIEMAEHDYQKSLPSDRRAVANRPTDFKCPHCLTHQKPELRKEKMVSGGLFFTYSYLVDIFRCTECKREFTDKELNKKVSEVMETNWQAECFERYHDGEITDKVFKSLTNIL